MALITYGSLVPFDLRMISLSDAVRAYLSSPLGPGADSHTDFIVNVALFLPLGYVLLAWLRTDRRGRAGDAVAAAGLVVGCAFFSGIVEFAQAFSATRTSSINDSLAETIGACGGAVAWLLFGRPTTEWLRSSLRRRGPMTIADALLLLYCAGLVFAQWMPLDATANLGQLARKFREGRIDLALHGYGSWGETLWTTAANMLMNAPVGMAAVLLRPAEGTRRDAWRAAALGIAAVSAIEMGQVFVYSRTASLNDLLGAAVGACAGISAVALGVPLDLDATRKVPERSVVLARWGAIGWALVLVLYHWHPFNFTLDPLRVSAGAHQFLEMPFRSYVQDSNDVHALSEVLKKTLMALPLGLLFSLSWPGAARVPYPLRLILSGAVGVGFLLALELGQILLPSRTPDISDVLVGAAGLGIGWWLTGRLRDNVRAFHRPSWSY